MTVVSRIELGRELARSLAQVNRQIEAVSKVAAQEGIEPYNLRQPDGSWVLTPLLVAKANLLHGLTLVNDRRPQ